MWLMAFWKLGEYDFSDLLQLSGVLEGSFILNSGGGELSLSPVVVDRRGFSPPTTLDVRSLGGVYINAL